MADLLECLLQLRGLRDSLARLEGLVADAGRAGTNVAESADETVRTLLASGAGWQHVLSPRLPLSARHRADATVDSSPLAKFRQQRLETLAALDRCSAEDLASLVTLGDGRLVTIADVVAHILADDTERLGRLRRMVEDRQETWM
jgi:hypothetical protein